MSKRTLALLLLPVPLALAVSCGGDDTTGPSQPVIAAVSVTSPIDTLIARSRTVELSAQAIDTRGRTVSGVQFTWRSSNTSVATVGQDGIVQPVAPGSVTITAEAAGISGSLRLRIVDADLDGISAVLTDPFTGQLVLHLGEPAKGSVQSGLDTCVDAVSTGNIVAIVEGLATAQAEVGEATEPDDVALLAVLALLLDHAERLLNL
ncbi:MAG: Ig-like domain-containing protein [Gemmatimonadota bacterium]|nr:MAG: Ig-like domain-containing protein [Gemmatimonadota bacterium]